MKYILNFVQFINTVVENKKNKFNSLQTYTFFEHVLFKMAFKK